MSSTIGQSWFRIGNGRDEPAWGEVGRDGASGSLMDEREDARRQLGSQLVRLRAIWQDRVPPRFARRCTAKDLQGPKLAEVGLAFRRKSPDDWAALEGELAKDDAYRSAAAGLDRVDAGRVLADDLAAAARSERAIPSGVRLVQKGGSSKLDPFVEFAAGIHLVDDRFVDALVATGLGCGWATARIPIVDRTGEPVETHRLLVITARVRQQGFKGVTRSAERTEPAAQDPTSGAAPAIAGLVDAPDDLPTGLLASASAGAALAAAKLPHLTLTEERWIVTVDT